MTATDALGQVTTLDYEHATDPLMITAVEDPFGRRATFTCHATGQLASITGNIDPIMRPVTLEDECVPLSQRRKTRAA